MNKRSRKTNNGFLNSCFLILLPVLTGISTLSHAQETKPPMIAFGSRQCLKVPYPQNAIRNEEQGEVTVEITVNAEGEATNAIVIKSSGHRSLDNAFRNRLLSSDCKFVAGKIEDVPVEATFKATFVFKLN